MQREFNTLWIFFNYLKNKLIYFKLLNGISANWTSPSSNFHIEYIFDNIIERITAKMFAVSSLYWKSNLKHINCILQRDL